MRQKSEKSGKESGDDILSGSELAFKLSYDSKAVDCFLLQLKAF